MFYPDGGFKRATRYVIHRMSRLPDDPHRVARGVFAGTLVAFLPIPGLQFVGGWLLAIIMRGNILAALLATFVSNPITTPIIAVFSVSFGHWLLGIDAPLTAEAIGYAFADAGAELWQNFKAIFTSATVSWHRLSELWHNVWYPYFVGCLAPAVIASLAAYYITIPIVQAYQKLRLAKAKERVEKRRKLKDMLLAARAQGAKDGGDAGPPSP
ncbi:MAG: DUF2062 domain-containing protein [Paracoccaceae bacterium]